MKVKSESEVAQSCPTLGDPMDCSPPGSSTHGIFQARVLEWGAIAFSHLMLYGDLNGKEIQKKREYIYVCVCVCVCVTNSLCCTVESNYTPIQINEK